MKNTKRLMAMALAAAVTATAMPATVFAADDTGSVSENSSNTGSASGEGSSESTSAPAEGTVDVPAVSGGESSEPVSVDISVAPQEDGSIEMSISTPEGGVETASGMNVTVEGTRLEDAEGNVLRQLSGSDGLGIRVMTNDNGTPDDTTDDTVIGGMYCVDLHTGNVYDKPYQAVNLEDAAAEGYYTKEEAGHLRAVMNNGFISRGDGKGNVVDNLDAFKASLLEAKANGARGLESLTEDDINSITAWDAVSGTGMAVCI